MGSYKHALLGAMSLLLAVNLFAVTARIYVRGVLVKAFGWDDVFVILSYMGFVFACVMGFEAIHYGLAADDGENHEYYDYNTMIRFYWANQLVLYISSGIVKIAVALVLYRLATTVRNQAILVTSICVVVVWTCITTIFSTDMCATTGAADYAGSAVCTGVGYFRMISNIFLDYFYALYPIPMLWRSTLSQRMKVIVCCLLGLGIIASAATIAKLVVLVRMSEAQKAYELDWFHYQLLMWADIELGLAIFTCSVAALRPLIRVVMGHNLTNLSTPKNTLNGRSPDSDTSQAIMNQNRHQAFAGPKSDDGYELASMATLNNGCKVKDEEHGHAESTTS